MSGWFVEIVRWELKLRCVAKFTQIFCPEDGLPASYHHHFGPLNCVTFSSNANMNIINRRNATKKCMKVYLYIRILVYFDKIFEC